MLRLLIRSLKLNVVNTMLDFIELNKFNFTISDHVAFQSTFNFKFYVNSCKIYFTVFSEHVCKTKSKVKRVF